MRRVFLFLLTLCLPGFLSAQEVLLPLAHTTTSAKKEVSHLSLPFFDDFSDTARSQRQWDLGGTFVNQGYAPLPPTIGMATLDAYDAQGILYPTALSTLFYGDTLISNPIRLDSTLTTPSRPIVLADSLYLSFFYLPGGGYGNRWEGIGDVPEEQDSLMLDFYDQDLDTWVPVWSVSGECVDSLFAHTGNYWQYISIPINDARYLRADFRFRFRNLCSLDNNAKQGILGNADQWNIDYVYLNTTRHYNDSTLRDIAFVNPAPSMLQNYQAVPYRQYVPTMMCDSLQLTITNRFSQELASNYGYSVFDADGQSLYHYDGGYENVPVYWQAHSYQTSAAHAHPAVAYSFPYPMAEHSTFTIVHGIREGVSGDNQPQNDTISFRQVFDNYYAYDDGVAENGYGLTATSGAHPKIACRYILNTEDTLTAIRLYFNHTYSSDNADIRFLLTVWDNYEGHPGNIIYQDSERRRPAFAGFNQYSRYILEQPVICSDTIYVGLQQVSSDYLNLGFDRNCDASANILYQTSQSWQTTILRGALMLRPCFGSSATASIHQPSIEVAPRINVQSGCIHVESQQSRGIRIFDTMGRLVYHSSLGTATSGELPRGIYLVQVGASHPVKVIIL